LTTAAFLPPRRPAQASRPDDPVEIDVYYDFASSLCHVAHRVTSRMAPVLAELDLHMIWIPIDLSALLGWRSGHLVSDERRDHVRAIADGLDVPLVIPTHWLDSRGVHALALHQLGRDGERGSCSEPTLRERVFTRTYDEARPFGGVDASLEMAAECGLDCTAEDVERGLDALEAWTRHASDQMVSGVPTFMLGPWPFGGIQETATMESIFRRWTSRVRADRADG
jgi:predicted DsbA family dithiol-disulfide isomerase